MIVDGEGKIFEDRRKKAERRKKDVKNIEEKRKTKRRILEQKVKKK